MSQWSLDNPPKFPFLGDKVPYADERGWCHPDTGEVLVAIRGLVSKAGAANISKIYFDEDSLARGDDLTVHVWFNEKVDVTAGATLVVTAASGSNITLKAAAQTGTNHVLFSKKSSDGTTQETVPDRADTYSVGAQTGGGTIRDTKGAVAATGTLTLSSNPSDTETVTIDSKVYTFKTTLTNTDGYVLIGATKELSAENLANAINLGAGAGSTYAAATTLHSTVSAVDVDNTVLLTAKTAGTGGNSLGTTETLSAGAFGGATLAGGAAATASSKVVSSGVAALVEDLVIPAGVISAVSFDDTGTSQGGALEVVVTFDQTVDVTAGATLVVTTDAGDITLYAAGQTNVTDVVFDKQSDNSTPAEIPTDTAATGTLTLTGNPTAAQTLTIGSKTYTFRANIAAVAATGTLTNDGSNVTDGDTVTIDGKVYTFEDTLTEVDGHVKIGASNTATMTNLFHAINASGGVAGTDYATATTAHTTVVATNPTGTTVVVTAITAGTAGNSLATTEASTHLAWGGATLAGGLAANSAANDIKIGATASDTIDNIAAAVTGGAGSGTVYAAATVAHTTVTASNGAGDTLVVTALSTGTAGNSIATTETMSNATFAAATLGGGITAPTSLTIEEQDITGTIVDHGNTSEVPDVAISAELAAEAGEVEVTA